LRIDTVIRQVIGSWRRSVAARPDAIETLHPPIAFGVNRARHGQFQFQPFNLASRACRAAERRRFIGVCVHGD